MLTRILTTAAVLGLLAGPALAAHCPSDVAKIDEALAGDHGLSDMQVSEVQSLRDKGEDLHNAGQHGDSLEKLHEAMDILGIAH